MSSTRLDLKASIPEDNDENRSRVENIREFVGAVKEFEEKSDRR